MNEKQPENTGKSLMIYQCGCEKCLPHHDFGPSIRDHYLIHYIVSGKGIYRVNKKEYVLEAGHCFLITPGVLAYYQADENDPWEYYWVGFNGDIASSIVKNCGFNLQEPTMKVIEEQKAVDCLSVLQKSFLENPKGFAAFSKLYEYFDILSKSAPKVNNIKSNVVSDAIEYINRSYSYDISVNSIAKHVGLCRSQLFRQFKDELGVSPQEYLVGYRMECAYTLLKTTTLSVTEIMYSVGYQNINNFSKIFKKKYGKSPIKVRNSVNNEYNPCLGY